MKRVSAVNRGTWATHHLNVIQNPKLQTIDFKERIANVKTVDGHAIEIRGGAANKSSAKPADGQLLSTQNIGQQHGRWQMPNRINQRSRPAPPPVISRDQFNGGADNEFAFIEK